MGNQLELFNGQTVTNYKTGIYNALKKTIESMSDDEILYGNFEEWVLYYVERFTIQPIVLYLDSINRTLSDTKVEVRNQWYPYNNEPRFCEKSGYEIKYEIPYSGDYHLLSLQPSTRILVDYHVLDFIESKANECGSFCLCMKFTIQELPIENDIAKAYVERRFDEKIEYYKTMIWHINQEIEPFNTRLRDEVKDLLNGRKNRAKHKNKLCNLLNIPLKKNPDVPNLNPVTLKLIKKTYANPPKIVQPQPEYCITDQDYDHILKVIHQCCTVMGENAKTSNKFEEEELRDQILATLGTHYLNNAWGETFRRKGKTDILIPFENRAAFIAECKIWHGIKGFEEAIDQLFSYSTWKDIKVAVIIFNKTNKDFLSILKMIQDWIIKNSVNHSKQKENYWKCIIHEKKRNLNFELAVFVYDLSLNL